MNNITFNLNRLRWNGILSFLVISFLFQTNDQFNDRFHCTIFFNQKKKKSVLEFEEKEKM